MTTVKITGMDELQKKLKPDTIKKPLEAGIKKIAMALKREIIVATPRDEGILASGIAGELVKYGQDTAEVGIWSKPGKEYASFVEYGHHDRGGGFVEARHVTEGSSVRIFGKGMFAYGLEQLKKKMGDLLKGISIQIDRKWGR